MPTQPSPVNGNAPQCPKCGTANYTIRKVCRNVECAADLVLHPERDIDDVVRWDAEDARRHDAAMELLAAAR